MMLMLSGKKIIFAQNVLDIFSTYRQYDEKRGEAGGILLGEMNDENILVTKVSFPNKYDQSSRYGFLRKKETAQLLVDYEFLNSHGKTVYLGEWHTHPENDPKPSLQDISMIENQYENNATGLDFLLLVIVGINNLYVGSYPTPKPFRNIIKLKKD